MSTCDLPTELLITIFEAVRTTSLDDSRIAYKTLSSASLVCRQWRSAVLVVLLSHVEISRKKDAQNLARVLSNSLDRNGDGLQRGSAVRDLVLGIGSAGKGDGLTDVDDFHAILERTPRLQRLVVLHHDAIDPIADCTRPLPFLPDLTHVTLASASVLASPCLETNLLQQLPPTVKHLSLPGPERSRIWPKIHHDPNALRPQMQQLQTLAVQEWPTATTRWLGCAESMRELTVVYLGKVELAAEAYPNLTSLRILGRIGCSHSKEGFAALRHLEHLEIRDMSVAGGLISTLPPSTRSLRFWSSALVAELTELILDGRRLPLLEEVVWDWFVSMSVVAGKEANERVLKTFEDAAQKLEEACKQRGIVLRMLQRVDAGRGVGSLSASTRPKTQSPIPARLLSTMLSPPLSLSLAHHFQPLGGSALRGPTPVIPGCWSPIWEDVFEGHGSWLREVGAKRSQPQAQCKTEMIRR